MKFVQFSDASKSKVISVFAGPQDPNVWQNLGEVGDDDVRYLAFVYPQPSAEDLANAARAKRDGLLRNVCDAGVLMIQREIRRTNDAAKKAALNAKLTALDQYAVALQAVPEQEGFPLTIDWPVAPTE